MEQSFWILVRMGHLSLGLLQWLGFIGFSSHFRLEGALTHSLFLVLFVVFRATVGIVYLGRQGVLGGVWHFLQRGVVPFHRDSYFVGFSF